jgi:hypothetical protein
VPRRSDDRLDRKGGGRAQDGADIVRIGDLVEHQHDAVLGQAVQIRRFQRLDLGQEALMHGIGPQTAVDLVRPHQNRRHAGVDFLLGEAPGGVFGQNQLEDFPLWIGQRHGDGMPSIEDGRAVAAAGFPAAPGRAPSVIPALIAGFIPGFIAALATLAVASLVRAALKSLFSVSLAHGWLVSRMPNNGNLECRKGGLEGRIFLPGSVDFAPSLPS